MIRSTSTMVFVILVMACVPPPQPARGQDAKTGLRKRTHMVPPGKYTAIVVTGVGDPATFQSSVVTIKERGGKEYPVNGEPGKTTLLQFSEGWEVQKDRVTVEVESVQGTPTIKPSAVTTVWGTTPTGPVEFPERK